MGDDLNGRILVLENDSKRYDKDIRDIWEKVSEHDVCVASFPKIEKALETMASQLSALDKCRIAEEAQKSFWDTKWGDRLWTIVVSIAVVIATLLAAIAMHLNFGGV